MSNPLQLSSTPAHDTESLSTLDSSQTSPLEALIQYALAKGLRTPTLMYRDGQWRAELASHRQFDRRYAYGSTAFSAMMTCLQLFDDPQWPETEHRRLRTQRRPKAFTGSGQDLLSKLGLKK